MPPAPKCAGHQRGLIVFHVREAIDRVIEDVIERVIVALSEIVVIADLVQERSRPKDAPLVLLKAAFVLQLVE